MKKLLKKLSIFVVVTLLLSSNLVFAEGQIGANKQMGSISISVEKLSLGAGYIVEPVQVPIYQGDTGITVLNRVLGNDTLRWRDNYLVGIYGAQKGRVNVPAAISKMESHRDFGDAPTTESALAEGLIDPTRLSEFDYSPMSGWMYAVNNVFPGVGFDGYSPKDGDVFRVQFTLWGLGADLGQNFPGGGMTPINKADKTDLTKLLAEINSSTKKSQYLKDPSFKGLYDQAYAMMQNFEATTKQVQEMTTQLKDGIPEMKDPVSISYHTHIQNDGWEKTWKIDGDMSGTEGRSLRLEGIEIKVNETAGHDLGIRYKTHIENIGWETFWSENGAMSGTEGRALRLEAIDIELTGADAGQFDVYYQVHAQNVGWMDWAKNGDSAGTAGFAYRLEGIRIQVVPKGEAAPGPTDRPFVERR